MHSAGSRRRIQLALVATLTGSPLRIGVAQCPCTSGLLFKPKSAFWVHRDPVKKPFDYPRLAIQLLTLFFLSLCRLWNLCTDCKATQVSGLYGNIITWHIIVLVSGEILHSPKKFWGSSNMIYYGSSNLRLCRIPAACTLQLLPKELRMRWAWVGSQTMTRRERGSGTMSFVASPVHFNIAIILVQIYSLKDSWAEWTKMHSIGALTFQLKVGVWMRILWSSTYAIYVTEICRDYQPQGLGQDCCHHIFLRNR